MTYKVVTLNFSAATLYSKSVGEGKCLGEYERTQKYLIIGM